jgi:hypothetical protein
MPLLAGHFSVNSNIFILLLLEPFLKAIEYILMMCKNNEFDVVLE